MKSSRCVVPALILFLCCLANSLFAAPPKTISYQGYLKDGTGKPVTAATNLTFRLYSSTRAESGPLWSESKSVTPANGVYSVELGTGTPLDSLPFDAQYFLGVTVGGGSELTPRQSLSYSPYAFRALQSDNVSTASQIVSTVPTGTPPLQVNSRTLVPNLNADMIDGKHGGDFVLKAGDTMTGSLNLSAGNLTLPATTATGGIIRQGSNTLIHTYGAGNFFAGSNTGNLTMTGNDNTASGSIALRDNTTGYSNTASGYAALSVNTTGNENTAFGASALSSNTSGIQNTASGSYALRYNTTGYSNTASGHYALASNTIGYGNTASGYSSLASNTTGYYNTASGFHALQQNTTGFLNTASGFQSLLLNTTGNYNTATGAQALFANTTGNYNTASGTFSLYTNTTGSANTASGYQTLNFNTTGSQNTVSGYGALYLNTTGYSNTASGYQALLRNTTGNDNTAVGYRAGINQTTGSNNIYIGSNVEGVAGESNVIRIGTGQTDAYLAGTVHASGFTTGGPVTAGSFSGNGSGLTGITAAQTGAATLAANTFTGTQTLSAGNLALPATTSSSSGVVMIGGQSFMHDKGAASNTFVGGQAGGGFASSGSGNTGIGYQSLYSLIYGTENTAVGYMSLKADTNGKGNSAYGYYSLFSNVSGSANSAFGEYSLMGNTTGSQNDAFGQWTLINNESGAGNVAIGAISLYYNATGNYNTAVGNSALVQTGEYPSGNTEAASYNTALGYHAGNGNYNGSYNTFIGYNAVPGYSQGDLVNATAVGANAVVSQSNSLVLGGTGTNAVKVGIGTETPQEVLDVVGNVRIHDKDIFLRGGTDTNHGLGWYGSNPVKSFASVQPDGPVLYGFSGGALGTTNGGQKIMMSWTNGLFDFYGYARFRVLSSGSTSACLDVNNSISTCSSDIRMKKDVVTLSEKVDVLEALPNLRGVMFTWDRSNGKAAGMGDGQDMGMIAQEVETVFPEVVHTDQDGYKSLDYPKLVAFLIEVNKAQQTQLAAQKDDMGRLSRMMEELNARLSAVEAKR